MGITQFDSRKLLIFDNTIETLIFLYFTLRSVQVIDKQGDQNGNFKIYFGSLLIYLLFALPIVNIFYSLGELYFYSLIGIGILTVIFILIILKDLSVEYNTPLAYSIIILGSILAIYGLYDPPSAWGIPVGGILVIIGLILRVTMLELLIGNIFESIIHGMISFFRNPLPKLLIVIEIFSLIFTFMQFIPVYRMYGYISLGASLLVLIISKIKFPEEKTMTNVLIFFEILTAMFSLQVIPVVAGHSLIIGLYLTTKKFWIAVASYTQTVFNWFAHKLRNIDTILILLGIVLMFSPLYLETFNDSIKITTFVVGAILLSVGARQFFSALLGSIFYYASLPFVYLIGDFSADSVFLLLALLVTIWDIFGFYLPANAYILRFWQLPAIAFSLFALSVGGIRKWIVTSTKKMWREPGGKLRLLSYLILYFDLVLISPFGDYFTTILLVGIVLNIFSRPRVFKEVVEFVNWVLNNLLKLVGWMISIILIILGILVISAPDSGNSLTRLAGGVSGPAKIVLGIGLIMAGGVFFREVYRNKKEVQK